MQLFPGKSLKRMGRLGWDWLIQNLVKWRSQQVGKPLPLPTSPLSLFILRNNDLGDLLAITPLFEALRDRFPDTKIAVGVGDWNRETLKHNPYIDEIISINAPWFNKVMPRQSLLSKLNYLAFSPEIQALQQQRFDLGIDVLGSSWGALLLLQAGIPYRLGMQGFAGGEAAMQGVTIYNPQERVGKLALRFAELLGGKSLPDYRPQIFLTPQERQAGVELWQQSQDKLRLAIAPGSGLEKKYWPINFYQKLLTLLTQDDSLAIAIVGGKGDRAAGKKLQQGNPKIRDLTGKTSLRETFALIAAADRVICNSSMILHVAAAFDKPTIVLLGEAFPSRKEHDAQWGYDRGYYSLGKECTQGDRIATPDEAIALWQKIR
ncbi:MAG: glycosyltransferase family 9 protein [Jaaginema sp. PMC 1079.18]|nr:glycosyltransferase family 9 protein [Jaaginema sp. PMC 1080.18]MEC4852153.1 glycosyltransferase family 9 protein [Jaaginema sp. PMC 1079.18]MEC4867497.1 glycosyltransferase family 9 protein [Jaaginema sp. PMC 1078.18]